MAAIFVYIRKGTGRGNAWSSLRAADLLRAHNYNIVALPRRIPLQIVYWLGFVKLTKRDWASCSMEEGRSAKRTALTYHDWASCQV